MNPSHPSPTAEPPRFNAPDLQRYATQLLTAAGLAPDRALDVAEVLLEGDLLGHTTHGLALLPAYLKSLQDGLMEKEGDPVTLSDHGAALTWDGRYLPGPWLVRRAIALAQARAQTHPVVTLVIRQSHHIGCLQAYLKPVTDAGLMILLSSSDPAGRTVAPHGGLAPRFTPNPLAAGFPTRQEPILIDISSSTTANGLCQRLAAAEGRLPGPWLIDRTGQPTDDPQVLFQGQGGSLLPLGGLDLGHKGFALALIVEAMTSALAGHGRADAVNRWGASVFLQIINPECFGGRDAFTRETDFFSNSCQSTPVRPGAPPVRLPGQGALQRRATQLAAGVALYPTILPALKPWADAAQVAPPLPR